VAARAGCIGRWGGGSGSIERQQGYNVYEVDTTRVSHL